MVEVVNNRQFEDVEKPAEDLQDDADNIVYSDEAQLEDVKTTENDEEDIEKAAEGSNMSPSKWSQLTRILRMGLGRGNDMSQGNSSKDGGDLLPGDLKPMEKRGSLGKLFRQGFSGFPRPVSAREPMKSEFESNDTTNEALQNKKGPKWNVFKHRKSLHQLPETEENQSKDEKEEGKRRPLSKMLHGRALFRKENQDTENPEGTSNQEQIPSPQSRIQSLGKFFRQNKNTEFLESTYDKNQQNPDTKTPELQW